MEKVESVHIPAAERHRAPVTPAPDPSAISEAAQILVKANNPLILAGNPGRKPEAVTYLVELAETLGAPVVISGVTMNFPTDHHLYAGFNFIPHLDRADVVLVVDYDIPCVPARQKLDPNARFIHIQIDPLRTSIPQWHFPAHMLIEADSSKALPALNKAISSLMTGGRRTKARARSLEIKEQHQRLRDGWRKAALDRATQRPISLEWLSYCISKAIASEDIVLDEAVTGSLLIEKYLERTRPQSLFRSGGSSLGWGLGAALGVKLAARERTVVTLVGEGSFVFGCPIAALWAAKAHQAPFLCIVLNNGLYKAVKRSLQEAYGKDSYSERTGTWIGMDISPCPDYASIARACGCYGDKVQEPQDIQAALRRALKEVKGGNPAVVDVIVEKG